MKDLLKRFSLMMAVIVLSVSSVFADKTPIDNLYEYHLDNGLTLFVAENHSVPLAYVEIAVKAGATTQTPETAGLFHLYEHMMFKGNALYKDAASVQKALSDMGVASWNGTTSTDHVNYFFTIPSDQLENGLAFWNAAVRAPSMDSAEFEGEKKVVLSEIEGDSANPGSILYDSMCKAMFPNAPYRVDSGGSFNVVANATIDQMRYIQNTYYIPCNAALFVGGDVKPAEVYKLVNKIYGSWSNNGNVRPENAPQQDPNPFAEPELLVMPYSQLGAGYAMTRVMWRGPDTDFDIEDTYAADYLCQLMNDPEGPFVTSLVQDERLGIPTSDYVSGGYGTSRASGQFVFTAYMLQPQEKLAERAKLFMQKLQDNVLPGMAEDANLYSKEAVAQIAQSLKDGDILAAETAEGLLSNLRFWWCCSDPDYYYSYNDKIASVTQDDVKSFVNKYFADKSALVVVAVNPSVYESTKAEYKALGYKVIEGGHEWWRDEMFAPDADIIASQTGVAPSESIYAPSAKAGKNAKIKAPAIKTYKLANGIPVYVEQNKGAKVDAVSIGLKGGVSHTTYETAGLEKALFTMMSMTSGNYDFGTRNYMQYVTNASVSANSYMTGSLLNLTAIDEYFYDVLPLVTDGFVNPDFNEELFGYMMNDFNQTLESTFNDPASYLSYEMLQTIYKDHPYKVRTTPNRTSIENITIDAMEALYKDIITPEDLYVVAVGNVDGKKLVKELNESIGKLKSTGKSKPEMVVPSIKVKGEPVVLTHPAAAGAGFVARVISTPEFDSPDYMAAVLSKNMYNSVMFNVVREHYGDCYTPYSVLNMSKGAFGYEYLFKATDYENFAKDMAEARSYLAAGKLIESLDDNGEYVTTDIASRLQSYKNSYINATYEENATTSGVCSNMAYNVMMYGDPAYDTKQTNSLLAASADDVLKAFNRYFMTDDYRWFVITGPEAAEKVNFEEQ